MPVYVAARIRVKQKSKSRYSGILDLQVRGKSHICFLIRQNNLFCFLMFIDNHPFHLRVKVTSLDQRTESRDFKMISNTVHRGYYYKLRRGVGGICL
jgi:hypothetical protein